MKNIRDFINNDLVDRWKNKELNLKIEILMPHGETYIVQYFSSKNGKEKLIGTEKIRIAFGTSKDNFVHFSCKYGSWKLRGKNDKELELFHEDPITKQVKYCWFFKETE